MTVVGPVRCEQVIAAVHVGRERAFRAVDAVGAQGERKLVRRQRYRHRAPLRDDLLHLRGILRAEPQALHVVESGDRLVRRKEAAVSGIEIAQTGQALLLKRVHRIRPHIPVEDAEQMLIRGVLIRQLKRRKLRRIGCGRRERCAHEVDAAVNALLERRSIRAKLVFKARDDLYRAAAFLFDERTEPLARLIGEVVRALAACKAVIADFCRLPAASAAAEQQEQQERRHAPKAVIHLSISYYKSKDKTGSIVNICSMTGKKTASEKFASVFLCILHNVFPLF